MHIKSVSTSFLCTLCTAFLMFSFVGCSDSSQSYSTSSDVKAKTTSSNPGEPVAWPNLETLDHLSHQLMAYMEASDYASIIEQAPFVNKQLNALAKDEIPANAKSKAELKEMQDQLLSLTRDFDDLLLEQLSPEQQARIIIAFSPITHKMMRVAGVPHKHDAGAESKDAADEHEGHDHESGEGNEHEEEAHDHGAEGESHEGHAH